MVPLVPRIDATRLPLESLFWFDTSMAERLRIDYSNPPSSNLSYRALLPMKRLRALSLSHCADPDMFIRTLDPSMNSSEVVVCPKLEELVLVLRGDRDANVIDMTAARASRGAKLMSVRIIGQDKSVQIDVLEPRKNVLHLEYGPGDGVVGEDIDTSDWND